MPLSDHLYADEAAIVETILAALPWDQDRARRVQSDARALIERVRAAKRKAGELETFLQHYGLNTEEGLALMTLAEALLRIPDSHTAGLLIRDKMKAAEWLTQQGQSSDWMVKAAGFGLSLTKKTLDSAFSRLGEPLIRKAMVEALKILGGKFVLGRDIREALKQARPYEAKGYRMSYDMLGEGSRTREMSERYFSIYHDAIKAIAGAKQGNWPGISIKLSALHPRYEYRHAEECVGFLSERLADLAIMAASHDVPLTVDAEEVDRLETSLKIIGNVARDTRLSSWDGFGLAVQAYGKRALPLLDELHQIARTARRRLQVRLVKGAYWDAEIKRAQVMGLPDYPVFTRKANTDLSYLACADVLLRQTDAFYPMFGTHNAFTVAAILDMAGPGRHDGFEFQRLHGMGETLHDQVLQGGARVTVYAPCGGYEDLLPYLVRRLLENGASTSFVHKLLDPRTDIDELTADPVVDARDHPHKRHARIPLPMNIYGTARLNAAGLDLTEPATVAPLLTAMRHVDTAAWEAAPLIAGHIHKSGVATDIVNPADLDRRVGQVWTADTRSIEQAFEKARQGFVIWSATPAPERAATLRRLADLLEAHRADLMGLCVREAGKTIDDALAEVREAVDFCRYYAWRGEADFAANGITLPGPTGESNRMTMHGRGVFICISPWNFPLAIFVGQVAAALMAGNAVIAKPAEQTPLIAMYVSYLIYRAGVPAEAFSLLPGDGVIGAALVAHPDVAGVAFTGSGDVARRINRALAAKDGPIVPLIAETGGQNAMIVDSSALPEQVIDDVLASAFGSSGQRCSALRVLYVQEELAEAFITMLRQAMATRVMGDPMDIRSDTGPVIDRDALAVLNAHLDWLDANGRRIGVVPVPDNPGRRGYFFAPVAYEINSIRQLDREVFGPILHVIRFKGGELGRVMEDINATGYGLTLGLHTRIGSVMRQVAATAQAGNVYINRGMTGAVVGVQPFGGMGLSGTGPKAGGPHYLHRFALEKVVSIDTTRQGGNASLVMLDDDAS